MNEKLFQILSIVTVASTVGFTCGFTTYSNCGARGGSCGLECSPYTIQGITHSYNYNKYDYKNYDTPNFPACVLQNLDYSGASENETILDLSGKSILLNYFPNDLSKFDFSKIKILSLYGNVFHNYGNQDYLSYNTEGLPAFVKRFDNLEDLDISNITARGRNLVNWGDYWELNQVWSNTLGLKYLDVSANRNIWSLSSDAFQGMVSLRGLRMSECCEALPSVSDFFRDLNNLEYLDLSGNPWTNPAKNAFFSMPKLKHLDISRTNATFDPSTFFARLPNLEQVYLNQLHDQTLNISNFKFTSDKIWELSLSGNKVSGFPQKGQPFGLINSSALEYLDLSNVDFVNYTGNGTSYLLEDLPRLKFLNVSGSANLIRDLNSTLLQNCTILQQLDLSNLELWEARETKLFENLHSLQYLLMSNVTIYGHGNHNQSVNRNLSSSSFRSSFIDLRGASCNMCNLISLLGQFRSTSDIDLSFARNFSINLSHMTSVFPQLEKLNLSRGTFPSVDLLSSGNLKRLDLSGIQTTEMKLSQLPKMRFLKLSDDVTLSGWDGFPFLDTTLDGLDVPELKNLTSVDFSGSKSEKLVLRNLDKLEKIHLSNVSINVVGLENLTSLKHLDLSSSKATQVNLTNLPRLEHLDLSNSKLQNILMRNASTVKNLNMSFVVDKELIRQVNVNQFRNLVSLNMSSCELWEVPENFSNFEFLRSVDLSNNFLNSLSHQFLPPGGKGNLINLNLSHNYFDVIPFDVIELMIDTYSSWKVNLEDNLLNCSDCRNSWMSLESYFGNIEGALCQTPFEKYHVTVKDAEICRNREE